MCNDDDIDPVKLSKDGIAQGLKRIHGPIYATQDLESCLDEMEDEEKEGVIASKQLEITAYFPKEYAEKISIIKHEAIPKQHTFLAAGTLIGAFYLVNICNKESPEEKPKTPVSVKYV